MAYSGRGWRAGAAKAWGGFMSESILAIDLGFVNAYLLRAGAGFVLVDTGLPKQWARLTAALASAGCGPHNLSLAVITHADFDHAGSAHRLQAEWKTPIAVHSADAPALETGELPPRSGRGPVSRLVMVLMALLRRISPTATPLVRPDILLEDGQSLCDWELDATVLHLPGHTRGAIAIHLRGGALIAGDVFANRGKPDISPFIESLEAYRASLARTKSIAPAVTTVYPGHGPSFPGAAIGNIEL